MSDVKRYDHTPRIGWEESADGEWVKAEDHDAVEARKDAAVEALAKVVAERDDLRKRLAEVERELSQVRLIMCKAFAFIQYEACKVETGTNAREWLDAHFTKFAAMQEASHG